MQDSSAQLRESKSVTTLQGPGDFEARIVPFGSSTEDRVVIVEVDFSRRSGHFDAELVALLREISDSLAFAYRKLQAEASVRESEERFRALTSMASDWYWETDAEMRFTPPRRARRRIAGFVIPCEQRRAYACVQVNNARSRSFCART